jgi:hypothetical protein
MYNHIFYLICLQMIQTIAFVLAAAATVMAAPLSGSCPDPTAITSFNATRVSVDIVLWCNSVLNKLRCFAYILQRNSLLAQFVQI